MTLFNLLRNSPVRTIDAQGRLKALACVTKRIRERIRKRALLAGPSGSEGRGGPRRPSTLSSISPWRRGSVSAGRGARNGPRPSRLEPRGEEEGGRRARAAPVSLPCRAARARRALPGGPRRCAPGRGADGLPRLCQQWPVRTAAGPRRAGQTHQARTAPCPEAHGAARREIRRAVVSAFLGFRRPPSGPGGVRKTAPGRRAGPRGGGRDIWGLTL